MLAYRSSLGNAPFVLRFGLVGPYTYVSSTPPTPRCVARLRRWIIRALNQPRLHKRRICKLLHRSEELTRYPCAHRRVFEQRLKEGAKVEPKSRERSGAVCDVSCESSAIGVSTSGKRGRCVPAPSKRKKRLNGACGRSEYGVWKSHRRRSAGDQLRKTTTSLTSPVQTFGGERG